LRGTSFDNSYNIFLASMAYDRRLNARTSIGEIVSVQSTDYDGPGSVLVITPQATARMSLSDNTDISGAVGVSFATVKNGLVTRRSTGLAFSGSLCHRGESDQLCASVARDQQTSTIAGPVSTLSAGLTYSRRLDAKQTVQLSASGSRYSAQDSGLGPLVVSGNSTYFNGGVAYTRQLGPRLSTGGNLSTRRLFRDGVDPKADVSGSLFLRIRLGDRQ
ncbi:MAG: hypothetical protein ABIR77_06055, partial [Sphingomicrobium sp.]